MCLAMCLKKQEFQADCVYKLGVYKKKVCIYLGLEYLVKAMLEIQFDNIGKKYINNGTDA